MTERYSKQKPAKRLPSCMLRSYLLSIKFKITSITRWVALLKENPLYAILSGFHFGDVPGIGIFCDFFTRMWDLDSNNLSPKERFLKPKVKKGRKKGDKTPADTVSISSRLLPFFQQHPVKPAHAFFYFSALPDTVSLYLFLIHKNIFFSSKLPIFNFQSALELDSSNSENLLKNAY